MKQFVVWFIILLLSVSQLIHAQQNESGRPRIGLVLSGGGAKGFAHIGVIKVLEKAGIKIDYIGGTSMGSIIGGLYAMGYTTEQLDSIVRNQDWELLLSDKIPRLNLSIMEKDESSKYMISFPIREKKIMLPAGMVNGQNITNTFADLCSPFYYITDFSKFPIPYLCVAVDIENGREVVLKEGNLAKAMRASMAIPTVFKPELLDSLLLVDGGLINNFPAKEVKAMGADILIGVDVGYNYNKKRDMNSMLQIIEQSVFMHSRDLNFENHDLCNIVIRPDLTGYNIASFNQYDSIIIRGEQAALLVYDSLLHISEKVKEEFVEQSNSLSKISPNTQKYYINNIEVEGLNKIPETFLLQKLPFSIPASLTVSQINQGVQDVYGTMFFERITYSLEPYKDGIKLIFHVIEKNTNFFRAGLHYDSDYKATLVLNTTLRNFLIGGTKISIDLALGENPFFSALFYKNSGWNPKYSLLFWSKVIPDYGFRIQTHNFEVYDYVDDELSGSLGFTDVIGEFFIQRNISNNSAFGLSLVSDYTSISSRITSSRQYDQDSYYFNLCGYYKLDSYNETFFPSKGVKLSTEVKFVSGLSKNVRSQDGFIQATLRSNFVQRLGRRVSVIEGVTAGTLFADTVSSPYWYYLGGQSGNQSRGAISFIGVDFMQRAGNHALVTNFDLQWEMWNDNFLSVKSSFGKATRIRKNIFDPTDILVGYGLSYGYRSPIGPIEITTMSSNKNEGLSFFFNIGYWF